MRLSTWLLPHPVKPLDDPALAAAHRQFRPRLDRRAVVGHLLGTDILDLNDHGNGLTGQKLRLFRADLNLHLCPGRPGEQLFEPHPFASCGAAPLLA